MTVRRVVESVAARTKRLWRATRVGDDIAQQLATANDDREPVVLVADEQALTAGAWKVRASAIDSSPQPHVAVIVGLETRGTPLAPPDAQARLGKFLPVLGATSRATWFDRGTVDQLEKRLEEQIAALQMELLAAEPSESVRDPSLAANALEEGIDVTTRPGVSGPAGGAA
jgi:hypothetical protein